MQEDKTIINIKELCDVIHISPSMLRKLIYRNEIPYFRIGNRYLFNKKIINQWIISKHNDIELRISENKFI